MSPDAPFPAPAPGCARTDAVLAMFLDGDHELPVEQRAPLGYGFVSEVSLQEHLRACAICRLALRRARRLDALLAADTGAGLTHHAGREVGPRSQNSRAVARGQSAESGPAPEARPGDAFARLADRLLATAAEAHDLGTENLATDDLATDDLANTAAFASDSNVADAGSDVGGSSGDPGRGVANADAAARARADWSVGFDAARSIADGRLAIGPSRPATWFAAAIVAIAGGALWLCLSGTSSSALEHTSRNSALANGDRGSDAHGARSHASEHAPQRPGDTAPPRHDERDATAAAAPPAGSEQTDDTSDRPGSLAFDRISRELPEQQLPSHEQTAARVAAHDADIAERFAAGRRLLAAARYGSPDARNCADLLLQALATCGDCTSDEVALHQQLLDEVRGSRSVQARMQQHLVQVMADDELHTGEQAAALVVAARIGTRDLDLQLRRTLRSAPHCSAMVASALRCGIRLDGAAELLLECWRDEVAVGRGDDDIATATRWFAGQAASTFAQLPDLFDRSASEPTRRRCLLAMGCAADDSTRARLLAALGSPNRAEAATASCALASLPHSVLRPLLERARTRRDAAWLRAALVRADLPETRAWLRHMDLTASDLRLLRSGSLQQFSQFAKNFRDRPMLAD